MATAPKPRKRPAAPEAPKSLVAQAAVGEEPTTEARPGPEYRNWSVRLPADLVERIWGTCAALSDDEEAANSGVAFTVRAFETLLDELDAKHNNGKPHPGRDKSPFRAGGRHTYRR